MGVDTYLQVAFWLGIIGLVIRSIYVCGEYPRVQKTSLGQDIFTLILAGLFFAWVCFLRFGQ